MGDFSIIKKHIMQFSFYFFQFFDVAPIMAINDLAKFSYKKNIKIGKLATLLYFGDLLKPII
jgi:hypothetical protein